MSQHSSDRSALAGRRGSREEDEPAHKRHAHEGREQPHRDSPDAAQPDFASEDTLPGFRHDERTRRALERSTRVPVESLRKRLERVERQNRWMRYGMLLLLLVSGYAVSDEFLVEKVIVKQKLMESRELKLLDSEGNARLFVRMYSRVPVMQLLDSNGKPRMSMGLRFDDTPFIDLSDRSGRTRATFEMTEDDTPALKLMDAHGKTTFRIN